MKILITGSNGLLGQKLVAHISETEHELIATSRGSNRLSQVDPSSYTYASMDISNREEVLSTIGRFKPDVVIHTAAMTHVDQCEDNKEDCWKLNVESVGHIVDACKENKCRLVHVSTDFIFDGSRGPLTEEEPPAPVNYYGESKLEAERIVQQAGIPAAIARTVLVYGIAEDMSRSNIILWVKSSLEQGKEIHVVNDQWRTPTLAEDLASGCYLLAVNQAEGVFNISGKDFLTPYQMAIQTANYFDLDKSLIHETDSTRFSQRAKRPARTGFVIDKAREAVGYEPHTFAQGLEILHSQLA